MEIDPLRAARLARLVAGARVGLAVVVTPEGYRLGLRHVGKVFGHGVPIVSPLPVSWARFDRLADASAAAERIERQAGRLRLVPVLGTSPLAPAGGEGGRRSRPGEGRG